MIKVFFSYWAKSKKRWLSGFKVFSDVNKAFKFIKFLKNNGDYIYDSVICEDSEDLEYLMSRI